MSVRIIGEYTPEMAHDAAKQGAAWLDSECPDWIGHINLKFLALNSRTQCMLGQTAECLVGSALPLDSNRYLRVMSHFDKPQAWAIGSGFDVPEAHQFDYRTCSVGRCGEEQQARYEMLTIAWKELIRERLAGPAC